MGLPSETKIEPNRRLARESPLMPIGGCHSAKNKMAYSLAFSF